MILRSRVRDCLFLNWALPLDRLPEPPKNLRYQTHQEAGSLWVFVSALLFRQEGIHLASMPWARLSYPQLNLRFYTLDPDDIPSVLFHSMWVPPWVAPAVQFVGRQVVEPAIMRYPGSVEESDGVYDWSVRSGAELRLRASPGAAVLGPGPRLGSWEETVSYFRLRTRGYSRGPSGLRRVETSQISSSVWPMEVELSNLALLDQSLELPDGWPPLHSSWICPELTFEFEVLPEGEAALARSVPAPG